MIANNSKNFEELNEDVDFIEVKVICNDQKINDIYPVTEKIGISVVFKVNKILKDVYIKIQIFSSKNVHIFDSLNLKDAVFNQIGLYQRTAWIGKNLLNEDTYTVNLHLISPPFDMPDTRLVINKIATFETTFDKNTVKGKFKNRRGSNCPKTSLD